MSEAVTAVARALVAVTLLAVAGTAAAGSCESPIEANDRVRYDTDVPVAPTGTGPTGIQTYI